MKVKTMKGDSKSSKHQRQTNRETDRQTDRQTDRALPNFRHFDDVVLNLLLDH